MFNINKPGTQIVVAIILLVVIIGVGIFALVYKPSSTYVNDLLGNLSEEQFPINNDEESKVTSIVLQDKLTFSEDTLEFQNQWNVTEGYVGKIVNEISCTNNSANCPIYSVTKDNFTFYISSKEIKTFTENNSENEEIAVQLNTALGTKDFKHVLATVYVPIESAEVSEDSVSVNLVKIEQEIFGCVKENICLSTGIIPLDTALHDLYMEAFNDLLLSIKIV